MTKTNFHTHTIYCDGKDSPEDLVIAAIKKGFTALGFSGHSFFEIDKSYSMSPEAEVQYFDKITALKEKYKGQIEIYCGIEQDIYSEKPKFPYDYIIGSVHNIYKNGEYLIVDGSISEYNNILEKYYNGNFDLFAKDYYEVVSTLAEKTNPSIIGHFDLILKNMERVGYTPTPEYYNYAKAAVLKLLKHNIPFEINTGAMARGYRTSPYPDFQILKFICDNGGSVIFSSDCHQKDNLDFGLEKAKETAKKAGFTKQAIVTKDGIEYIAL
jgi:histidinol-phosphatase (PHP family)